MLLVIDNYDSFTFNLVQYFGQMGVEQRIFRNNEITPAEARIDWTKPAREIDFQIRGLSPTPGAWFELDGARVKALQSRLGQGAGAPGEVLDDQLLVACGDGAVRLLTVQREGRGPLEAQAFLRGQPVRAGVRLA